MKRLLFVCSQNRLRSPTAEQVFSQVQGVECTSAGTNNDAENPLTADLIEWADLIFVMEKMHRNKVTAKFKRHLHNKRVICLDIPDEYEYMDSALIQLLKVKVSRFLPAGPPESEA
ncbi:low molecular weight protein tyrosine phosphatase family protein [Aquabacterium sp.]|uniref:low molecular weight protein tyrosine phosphatase family protein n=1 Tax=Aquabacterium sp. TaxID=1872578 RepID=UPI003782F2A2